MGPPRRQCLPAASGPGADVSLWNILWNNIGKDLSKVSMPVQLNEPLSTLQRLCEELEYSSLLDQASQTTDPCERMVGPPRPRPGCRHLPGSGLLGPPQAPSWLMVGWWRGGISSDPPAPRPLQVYIAAFAVSAYSSTYHRAGCKPFNPVLGETYECERPDRGFRFISEQVRPWKKWAGQGSHVAKAGEHPGFKGPGHTRASRGQGVGENTRQSGRQGRSSPLLGERDFKQGVTVPCCRAGIVEAHRRLFSSIGCLVFKS